MINGAGFNMEAYQRRLEAIKGTISADELCGNEPDSAWAKDVSLRYGRFLAQRTLEQLQRAVENFAGIEFVPDKQKHREWSASELMGTVSGLHAASAMIRGAVVVADPIGAEAMMRIYEEANTPKGEECAPVADASPASSSD